MLEVIDGNRIGIIGAGQLGRMLAQEALRFGFDVVALEDDKGSIPPAVQVGARWIKGDINNENDIERLAAEADTLTIEIEHVAAAALIDLALRGYDVQPSPRSLQIIKDKLHQKQALRRANLPTAPFMDIPDEAAYHRARNSLGNVIIKGRTGGYDGRRNLMIKDQTWQEVETFFSQDSKAPSAVYAEQVIPFEKELAFVGARDRAGTIISYPIVQTIHEDNICKTVLAPAPIGSVLAAEAEELGRATMAQFEGAGVMAVEMFLDGANHLYVNEVAPRVHNSGHWTLGGARTSQFEQHIRAITGLPLGPTDMLAPAAVMVNILGENRIPEGTALEGGDFRHALEAVPEALIHYYGKTARLERKMGHITVLGLSVQQALERANQARALTLA